MVKNTSIALGEHFNGFIANQIKSGRFGSASEVVRAGLRLLENNETKLETLRAMLAEGEHSGLSDYSYETFIAELDEASQL
jgi:antitoxin ParD1/3/4